jgi:hypothetical protein
LIIRKTYENFDFAMPTPPSILVQFSKTLASATIQEVMCGVGAFFINEVMVPGRSSKRRFGAPFELFVFSYFLLARQNIECTNRNVYDHLDLATISLTSFC